MILSGTYLPLLIMLIALILRGVAFEFRFKAGRGRHWWDKAFHYGSLLATIAQGLVLGTFIRGFELDGRDFAGGMLDWLHPFALLTAARAGRGLRAARRHLADLAHRGRAAGLGAALDAAAAARGAGLHRRGLLVDAARSRPAIAERWFSWPNLAWLAPVPLVTAAVAFALHRAVAQRPRAPAVPADDGAVPALLPRPRHQPLAACGAARDHDLAGRGRAREPAASC